MSMPSRFLKTLAHSIQSLRCLQSFCHHQIITIQRTSSKGTLLLTHLFPCSSVFVCQALDSLRTLQSIEVARRSPTCEQIEAYYYHTIQLRHFLVERRGKKDGEVQAIGGRFSEMGVKNDLDLRCARARLKLQASR